MIWIILLGGMVQGAFAQNLEIKGMVRDARNKSWNLQMWYCKQWTLLL